MTWHFIDDSDQVPCSQNSLAADYTAIAGCVTCRRCKRTKVWSEAMKQEDEYLE